LGWRVVNGQVAWTSPKPLTGNAAVEFWSGGKLIGRAQPSQDNRTFSLPGTQLGDLNKVEVRAGGRRLDAPDQSFGPNQAPAGRPAGRRCRPRARWIRALRGRTRR